MDLPRISINGEPARRTLGRGGYLRYRVDVNEKKFAVPGAAFRILAILGLARLIDDKKGSGGWRSTSFISPNAPQYVTQYLGILHNIVGCKLTEVAPGRSGYYRLASGPEQIKLPNLGAMRHYPDMSVNELLHEWIELEGIKLYPPEAKDGFL